MGSRLRACRDTLSGACNGARQFIATAIPIFRPLWPALRIVGLLLAASVLVESLYPLVYWKLTDALVDQHARMAILMLCVLLTQSGLRLFIDYARERYEIEHIDWELNLRIMNASLERIAGFSMAQCSGSHTGKTRDIVRNGRGSMRELVFMAIYRVGPVLLRLLMALGALLLVSPPIGATAVAGALVYFGFSIWLFMRSREPLKALEDRGNENGKLFSDILTNMGVVMAYARQQRTVQDFNGDGQELKRQGQVFWRDALGWYYARNGIAIITRTAIMAVTAYLLFTEQFSYGAFVSITQWGMQIIGATQDLGQMQKEVSRHWAHMELYLQFINQEPEIVVTEGAVPVDKVEGRITFHDVTFTYRPRATDDPDHPMKPVIALDRISFEIMPGQKVAIIGKSGAGKSTVAQAIMRSHDPAHGHIAVDGVDLRAMDLNGLRRRIGYVPQHPGLFDRTLRYNLVFGIEDTSPLDDECLREALRLVKLEHLAATGGLDSKLGEGGHTLSGGERQRLCIARALIKKPDLLVFDEATSSLDPVNEREVQDRIDAIEGRTCVIIAHRYSTIKDVDRILVFDAGRLIGDGTHASLIRDCAYYQELLRQQGLM